MEHQVYELAELLVRFQHQLVWIHAFPNGNGRHARLMTDALAMQLGLPRFTWGSNAASQTTLEQLRNDYLAALRAADAGKIEALIRFARS